MPDDVKLLIERLRNDVALSWTAASSWAPEILAAADALERLHRPVEREAIARIICEGAGDDFDAFGLHWEETHYADTADAIISLLTTGGQVPAVPETHLLSEQLLSAGGDHAPGSAASEGSGE